MGAWDIKNCPNGAKSLQELREQIYNFQHPMNVLDFIHRFGPKMEPVAGFQFRREQDWDWKYVFEGIRRGLFTADEVDQAIHAGLPQVERPEKVVRPRRERAERKAETQPAEAKRE